MIEDKTLILLVGLVGLAWFMTYRVARFGWIAGRPKMAGTVAFLLASLVWLGASDFQVLDFTASAVVALSVPLLVYGWDDIRHTFTPERKGI